MDDVEKVGQFLESFFHTEFYAKGVERARQDLADPSRRRGWEETVALLRERRLAEGQALELVNHRANQVLDENTDQAAYAWLDRMVGDIEGDGVNEPYRPILRDVSRHLRVCRRTARNA